MSRELATLTRDIIATRSSHPRAAAVPEVIKEFSGQGIDVKVAENVPQALSQVKARAGKADLILVTGSIFVVGEAINYARADSSST
jgi:dihydrofolate synthase/folylpolyglutamate synthase